MLFATIAPIRFIMAIKLTCMYVFAYNVALAMFLERQRLHVPAKLTIALKRTYSVSIIVHISPLTWKLC